jgi:hypothetical protein
MTHNSYQDDENAARQLQHQQALNRFPDNHLLMEAYSYEKEAIDKIIDQALTYPSGANRWIAYEVLKKQAALLSGRDATHSELKTEQHYRVLTDFIEYLLPESVDELDTPLKNRYVDQAALIAWHQRAQQILEQHKTQRPILPGNTKSDKYLLLEQMIEHMIDSDEDDTFYEER